MNLKTLSIVLIITAILGVAGITAGVNLINGATVSAKLDDFDTVALEITPAAPKTEWFNATTGSKSRTYTLAPIGWTAQNPHNDPNDFFLITKTATTLALEDTNATSTFTVYGHDDAGSVAANGTATVTIDEESGFQANSNMYAAGEDATVEAMCLDLFKLRGTAFELFITKGMDPAGEASFTPADNYALIDALVDDSIAFLPVNEQTLISNGLSRSLVEGITEEYTVAYLAEIRSEKVLEDNYAASLFGAANYAGATAAQQNLITMAVNAVREMYTSQAYYLPKKDSVILTQSDVFQFQ